MGNGDFRIGSIREPDAVAVVMHVTPVSLVRSVSILIDEPLAHLLFLRRPGKIVRKIKGVKASTPRHRRNQTQNPGENRSLDHDATLQSTRLIMSAYCMPRKRQVPIKCTKRVLPADFTVRVIGVRQDPRAGLIRHEQIRHDLLAAPIAPLVADELLHLRREAAHQLDFSRTGWKAGETGTATHIFQNFRCANLVEMRFGRNLHVRRWLGYARTGTLCGLASGFDLPDHPKCRCVNARPSRTAAATSARGPMASVSASSWIT